jgi:serine/threonine protein kinase
MRRTKKRRGGKIVGEGRTVFVIDPPIPCKDDRNMSKYVTRLSKRGVAGDIISKNHKKLIEKLKEIDPSQKYFYYSEYCEPGALTQENKQDGVTYSNKKFSEIVLKGSEVWNADMRKTRSWEAFFKGKTKGKKLSMSTKNEAQIDHIRKAVDLLHKNGIVHGDLYGRNVVISAEDELPRIIDFGDSILNASDTQIEKEKNSVEDSLPSLDADWRNSR